MTCSNLEHTFCALALKCRVLDNLLLFLCRLRWTEEVSHLSPVEFKKYLRAYGVHVSVRAGAVRVSFGVYITATMVETFCALMDAFFKADTANPGENISAQAMNRLTTLVLSPPRPRL